IGADGAVLTANPAAENMLGLDAGWKEQRIRLSDVYSLAPIAKTYSAWQNHRRLTTTVPEAPVFVVIKPDGNTSLQGTNTVWGHRRELNVHLQLRFAQVDTVEASPPRTVIFLQDVTEIENQAQQLKLASMGRLTASIAHEVRNPLSAISHAATLLTEDVIEPGQQRLLRIVGDNVERLNRMIEDILKLSRKVQQQSVPLLLEPLIRESLEEFRGTHGLAGTMILTNIEPESKVWFDPLHLHEVLNNLLGNACRYASAHIGSIQIHTFKSRSDQLELHVQDDGPAISPEVRAHLFEPFYTTSSKGTGLGLYLARELCLNNGALLDYEYRVDGEQIKVGTQSDRESGRFVITFAATGLH
ncbi:MAG: ATP-binding protein, partial [Herbaspirillum sp.]